MEEVRRKRKRADSPKAILPEESSGSTDQEKNGVYLYCIFSGKEYALPLVRGIDNTNPIFSIKYGDIEALASYVPLSEYNEESLEKNLRDLQWIAPRAQAHERIIESVMRFCPDAVGIIPIKFCTIFRDESKVSEILRRNYEKLKSLHDYVEDKEEWGIKVYFNGKQIREADITETSSDALVEPLSQVAAESTDKMKEIEEKLAVVSPGVGYFLRRKRDRTVKENTEKVLRRLTEKIYEELQSWAVEVRRNKLYGRQQTVRDGEMVLNVAMLLKKSDVGKVKSNIDELAATYSGRGFIFELSGPWPPYNFCTEGIETV